MAHILFDTSNQDRFDLNIRTTVSDTEDKSAIIAVPVVVVFLVAASCITAFILYRR